ncbi:MAG: EamA family transporter [Armatimonadota bacterium]|nr:EamA family transporter [Armatimonadota bacterium]MDR7485037.1 EamA family transporter [Armatimonadota bacterium]MDR7534493.1 EamA family transporter [Armatimonadota bacterium]MDR7535551.1 EamA family transporter [Armatimonadota bacterium]
MTALALALILAAAAIHAVWNLLAKRAAGGGPFVWLFTLLSAVLYAPAVAALLVLRPAAIGVVGVLFMAGSALLHVVYFVSLQRGYQTGDLSLVYPLARGTGPLLATLAAVAVLDERPTPLALAGAALIVGGVFVLTGGTRVLAAARGNPWAVRYGLLTGATIACYTLWDKIGVGLVGVPPLVYDWGSNLGCAALLAPVALRRWREVRAHWAAHRLEIVGIALLAPLAYLLVLTAMVVTPVSYVAPAREISILVATVLGTRVLAEGDAPRRLAAAGSMVAGLVALALG